MAEHADLSRPQPLGVFPLPAGYLLIPSDPAYDEARAQLVAGKLPDPFPDGLGFYRLAIEGDLDGALAALPPGDDPLTMANRLVLDPDEELLARLRRQVDGALALHVETVAFALGLRPDPPEPGAVGGEIAAQAHAAAATAALERHDRAAAAEHLEAAAQAARPVSSALTGQMLGQLANVQLDDGGVKRAQVTFQAAIDALGGTDLHVNLAELHVAAGSMYQEMSEAAPRLMKAAIDHYLAALSLVTAQTAPEIWAAANANLGLAYLTTPMSEATDLLRVGVAVQSMREALTVFTPEGDPERWSSTQLNLANALVYMPSTHQADNIVEAVELYEQVLAQRDRHRDPQGRARVLANQGNALAHLGYFDQAKIRLHEARALFEEFAEDEAVRSVRSVLDEIAKQESLRRQAADSATKGATDGVAG